MTKSIIMTILYLLLMVVLGDDMYRTRQMHKYAAYIVLCEHECTVLKSKVYADSIRVQYLEGQLELLDNYKQKLP